MENLIVEKTKTTPQIRFDATTGNLEIIGESYPENAIQVYEPIFNWLKQYCAITTNKIIFDFKLAYFNTSSSKCIMNIMEILEEASENCQIVINWYYSEDDEDMLESGQEFAEDISFPFNLLTC